MALSFRSFRSILAAAALAVATVCVATYDRIADVLHRAGAWLRDGFKKVASSFAAPRLQAPQVLPLRIVRMRDYVERQGKLERPTVLPQWRLAPST